MSATAQDLVRRVASTRHDRAALALDLALSEHWRRYGDVRLEVVGVASTGDGVTFTVRAR